MQARHRDRRGHGIRGPLAAPDVPISRSRAEQFDDLVLDAMHRLERRWPEELSLVELAVEEVPPEGEPDAFGAAVPLGRVVKPAGRRPARIVVYRRPVEFRARDAHSRGLLVNNVVVERVAELLGLSPEVVDPDYGAEATGGGDRD